MDFKIRKRIDGELAKFTRRMGKVHSLRGVSPLLFKEIKDFADEFRERNGNSRLRIPNKDFNLWLVNSMISYGERINAIETKQKIIMYLFPILITVILIKG